MDTRTCMAECLRCSPVTTLLISYTPIENKVKKIKIKKSHKILMDDLFNMINIIY